MISPWTWPPHNSAFGPVGGSPGWCWPGEDSGCPPSIPTAKLTSYLFLLLSVFGGLLAFVCGLAHPGRRLKLLLVLLSLTYFAFAYMVKVAPTVR